LNAITRDKDDKAAILSDNQKEIPNKNDNVAEENTPGFIVQRVEKEGLDEEISFREENNESSTSDVQENVTHESETEVA